MPKGPAKVKSKKAKTEAVEREIIYKDVTVSVCKGDDAVTVEQAKKLLGWETESDKVKFGNTFLLKDIEGNKVRCQNNSHNRRFSMTVARTLMAEILRGKWRFNGESMIIGRSGETISAQHRLIGLILAAQEWEKDKERWSFWTDEPTLESVIVFGIDEGDETVNTVDTGIPRSLSQVIERSEYFAGMKQKDRHRCAQMADYAIRLLWHRTGAGMDAFAPKRTHAESLDFLARHPRILECVKHVYEENGEEGKIANYVSPGYAAGLMYLMGCCATDPQEYGATDTPVESMLDWKH